MEKESLRIGIALSGGGVRAAVFHLGVLGRLAADRLLENITFISTVSGGTLGTGLIYSVSGNKWPLSDFFLNRCLPQVKHYLTRTDIQRDSKLRLIKKPWFLLDGRANLISESIQKLWNISGLINDLATEPRWIINATAYESGKNWRFMPQRMGDYILNYVENPLIHLADAMASSAAYPGLIGPFKLKTKEYKWFKYTDAKNKEKEQIKQELDFIHLWDGGVYDNLGVEPLFKPRGQGFREEYNFLIVSNASKGIEIQERGILWYQRAYRLMEIAMDQIRALRIRTLIRHFQEKENSGIFLQIGNTSQYILREAGFDKDEISFLTKNGLKEINVNKAKNFETTLRRLKESEFDMLYQHGWEVANFTLISRCPTYFSHKEA